MKISFSKIILLTIFSFFILPNISFAYGTWDSDIGYYCPPETSTLIEQNYYTLDSGSLSCHYIVDNASWVSTKYGDTYKGTVGSSTLNSGHSLGSGCNDGLCDVTQSDTWASMTQDDPFFVAIYNSSDLTNCRTYFQTGVGSCASGNYGVIQVYWGDEPITNTDTRIIWNEPTTGTSTPSRTIDIDFDYYIDSVASTTYDRIHIDFVSLGYPDDDVERSVEMPLTYDDLINVATSTTLNRDGYYLGLMYFTDGISRVYGSQSIKLNSATTTLVADIPISNPVTLCDSLDGTFDTAICKSMMFLFYPSDSALNKFNSISDIFEDKIPFGYYYQFKNKIDEFVLSSTTPPSLSFDFGSNGSTAISGEMTIFDMGDIDTNFDFSVAWTWIIRFIWLTFGVYVIARTLQVASVI